MGAAESRLLETPFPIDPTQNSNLNRLSVIATRLLSTADLYDINNLSKPGVCGDYTVFLKDEITKQMLPYVTKVAVPVVGAAKDATREERLDLVYQTPHSVLKNDAVRKQVCQNMVNTMLRVVATVLACLASMQVKSTAREVAVAGSQRGGGVSLVFEWLKTNGYIPISSMPPAILGPSGTMYPLLSSGISASFREEKSSMSILFATKQLGADRQIGIEIDCLDPIQISANPPISVVPIRVIDGMKNPWLAGILKPGGVFKSFNSSTGDRQFITALDIIFSRAEGRDVPLIENRAATYAAVQAFNQIRLATDKQAAISRFMVQPQTPPGAAAAAMYGYPPGAAAAAMYGYPPGAAAAAMYGYPPGAAAPMPVAAYQQQPWQVGRPATAPILTTAQGSLYQIPSPTLPRIQALFTSYRDLIPRESTPAAVRAELLRGVIDYKTRTIISRVCQDSYWTLPNISTVFPWATFHLLSATDWSKLGGSTVDATTYYPEWREFIDELRGSVYKTGPVLSNTGYRLTDLKFQNINGLTFCKEGGNPHIEIKEVEAGIQELQGIYAVHVKKMWEILNSLITVIVDPDTKSEVVRLHPNVFKGLGTTDEYVAQKAADARKALKDFYLQVEKSYLKTIGTLRVA